LPHQDMRGNSDGLRKCRHCVWGDSTRALRI
jgi:hypothetical protein